MGEMTSGLIEGARFNVSENGDTVTKAYIFEDVPGNADQQLYNALTDSRVPRYGDPHPVVPGILVTNVDAEPMDAGIVKVLVTYSKPSTRNEPAYDTSSGGEERGTLALSATTSEEETKFDANGAPLKVSFLPSSIDDQGNTVQGKRQDQIATASVMMPHLVLSFSRRERFAPALFAIAMTGMVNRQAIGPLGPQTVLLTRVDANSDDGGASYMVTYEFAYDRRGWNQRTVAFIDPETGNPPATIVRPTATGAIADLGANFGGNGNGVAVYDFYLTADFGPLRLPWWKMQ